MNSESFKKAFGQVKQKDAKSVRLEIMDVLGITTNMAFRMRLNGRVEHTRREAAAIEKIFAKYGIKEVWGE